MEHLALEIFDLDGKGGSKYAFLPEDSSITITDTSEIFASGDVWSHSFTLNTHANAHIFGTAGEIHGSRLHEQINKRRARLWVEGLPLFLGYLKLDDEVDVDENGDVDVAFESGQKTFDDMIEGAKANQVPMMSDVRFGVALWRKRWVCVNVKLEASAVFKDKRTSTSTVITHEVHPTVIGDEDPQLTYFMYDGEDEGNSVQQYPRMVFPKGKFNNLKTDENDEEIDCLNTDNPYDDAHPYCNVALCYQKQGYTVTKEENGTKTTYDDYSSDPTAQRGYEVMPANRVNSAPNFFVIYWLRSLMKHLGIYVEENQMMDVEDLRRLFFVNTNCAYKEVKKLRNTKEYDWSLGKYQFGSAGNLVAEYFGDLKDERYGKTTKRYNGVKQITKIEDCGFECKGFTAGKWMERVTSSVGNIPITQDVDVSSQIPEIDHIDIKIKNIAGMSQAVRAYYDGNGDSKSLARNIYLHDAIATSECFPNVDISAVIQAIENGFGVRFLFSSDYKRVRVVLLRNVFRSTEVQDIQCEIISETKQENSIRGFRMTYGDNEDTHFFYKGFDDKLPKKKPYFVDNSDKHDYSFWNLNADYAKLLNKVTAFDKTCYVDPKTGNAYVIKVDKDAKRYDLLYPSLFGCADFMDAEDGDCTGEDATIKTINVGFTPAIMNDVNFEQERSSADKNQRFALYVDETMRPRRPDLKDLPNEEKQPGVKSYDDPDAVYSVDELYNQHGPNSGAKMVSDSVVQPGSFCIASDMFAERTGLSTELSFKYSDWLGGTNWAEHTAKCQVTDLHISGHINEGYRLYLQDNYEPNDDGISPIETHDWGLTLGIMRGSGSDAYVDYSADPDDGEGNDTWDIVAGSNVTAHPDTCDNYGNLWDYNGSDGMTLHCYTSADAINAMQAMWPNSNINLVYSSGSTQRNIDTCINSAALQTVDGIGLLFATTLNDGTTLYTGKIKDYKKRFAGMSAADMYKADKKENGGFGILIEVGSSGERMRTLLALQKLAFHSGSPVIIDGGENGVGVTEGRFSLKLRAEKPNPFYNASQPESESNRRYLQIDNVNLRDRGLADQFYKEYSYWIRNARIVKRTVRMELAQLLAIDKTVRVTVGDVTGFIQKMQYSVSNKTGLGMATMEIMYI
ncbi:MAG: hypothetical protein IJV24_03115 [Prevotella sp.]|nr:hypothetical protein [Prevotella sp.]